MAMLFMVIDNSVFSACIQVLRKLSEALNKAAVAARRGVIIIFGEF
ncbi:MAG: hypothetical protein ABSD72_00180 [Terracidiphilus sp.]